VGVSYEKLYIFYKHYLNASTAYLMDISEKFTDRILI